MVESVLPNDVIEKLNELFVIACNIAIICENLAVLEIEGRTNSDEYNKNLRNLNLMIEEETECLKELSLSNLEVLEAMNMLRASDNNKEKNCITSRAPFGVEDKRFVTAIKRVIGILINIVMERVINKDVKHFFTLPNEFLLPASLKQEIDRSISIDEELSFACENEVEINRFYILLDEIKRMSAPNEIYGLIYEKYQLIATSKLIESEFLGGGLLELRNIKWKSIVEALKVNQDYIDAIRRKKLYIMLQETINSLMKIDDNSFQEETTRIIATMERIKLRAICSVMADRDFLHFRNRFFNITMEASNNRMITSLIFEDLMKIVEDKLKLKC